MRLKAELRERVEAARTPDGRLPFLVNDMVIEEQLCQMRCSYCLTEEYNLLMNVPDARLRLTTDRRTDWLDILDRYHRTVDSPILRLSGGEFFWLRGSTEFVQEASARYETVQVITNGVFLTSQRLAALSALGNCQLNISLDGHTLELNRHRLPPRQHRLHDVIMRNLDAASDRSGRMAMTRPASSSMRLRVPRGTSQARCVATIQEPPRARTARSTRSMRRR